MKNSILTGGRSSGRRKQSATALASGFKRRQESEVLELAAIAADVSLDSLVDLELNPEANPLLEEALRRQYPNVDPESLAGASPENWKGLSGA